MITFTNKRILERDTMRDPIVTHMTIKQALQVLLVTELSYGAQVQEAGPLRIVTRVNMFGGADVNEYTGLGSEMHLLYETVMTFIAGLEALTTAQVANIKLLSLISTVMISMILKKWPEVMGLNEDLSRLAAWELMPIFLRVMVDNASPRSAMMVRAA